MKRLNWIVTPDQVATVGSSVAPGLRRRNAWLAVFLCVLAGSRTSTAQCEVQRYTDPPPGLFGVVSVHGDVAAAAEIGRVVVFRLREGEWHEEAILLDPDQDKNNLFLYPAVGDDVIAVADPDHSSAEPFQGAVYVYRFVDQTWQLESRLTASDAEEFERFGVAVAVDRDTIVVGVPGDDDDGLRSSGSVYVFRYDGQGWIEEAKLVDPNAEDFDFFGVGVAVRDDAILIGASGNNRDRLATAFVYRRLGLHWTLEDQLQAFDAFSFGQSVALAEDVAVIGAPQTDGQTGAAYVFRRAGSEWKEEAKLVGSDLTGPFPFFGWSVSISPDGRSVIAGAPFDQWAGFDSGSASVFVDRGDNKWNELAKLTASDGQASDQYGSSVSASLDLALVGAPGPSRVYFYAGTSDLDCNDNGESDACDIFAGTSKDENDNGVPDECECPADLDDSGDVGFADLLLVLAAWGNKGGPEDLDGSGIVDFGDLLIVLAAWGPCE